MNACACSYVFIAFQKQTQSAYYSSGERARERKRGRGGEEPVDAFPPPVASLAPVAKHKSRRAAAPSPGSPARAQCPAPKGRAGAKSQQSRSIDSPRIASASISGRGRSALYKRPHPFSDRGGGSGEPAHHRKVPGYKWLDQYCKKPRQRESERGTHTPGQLNFTSRCAAAPANHRSESSRARPFLARLSPISHRDFLGSPIRSGFRSRPSYRTRPAGSFANRFLPLDRAQLLPVPPALPSR